ncbi:MAG: LacI family DNA-binding transcriptional regulator, partial [Flavihumibacter sp.]|nr:LacI family DNA-binding transcriptional regulator [Flavihumibacter sp.]
MTILEIAKKLGVSASTVSRAMRNSHQISEKTKKKINDYLKEINFRPNPQASSLKRGSSKTIAVVIPDVSNYFFTLALNVIEEIANENNFHVLIYQTHENHTKEVEIINELCNGRVDGVIISVVGSLDKNFTHIKNLIQFVPVVFFDRVISEPGIPAITCKDYESGLKATQHLIELNCKKILFIGISEQVSVTKDRLAGYKKALKNNFLNIKKENILLCENEALAKESIKKALIHVKPDAVFSTVERYTLCLYSACNELFIKIPNDLKIISFYNSPTAALLSPPLSSISHPAFQMGKLCIESLLHKIKRGKEIHAENVTLDCEFDFRESSHSQKQS